MGEVLASLFPDKERFRSLFVKASCSKLSPKRDKDEKHRDPKSKGREATLPACIRGEGRILSAVYRCERLESMPNR
jgi:hypothetical protein